MPFRLTSSRLLIPLAHESIPAGFPSPAEDYMDTGIDLNEHLIQHPASTFFLRVEGDSMINAGIQDGDLLVVDRSLDPQSGCIVVAAVDGAFTLKRLVHDQGVLYLKADNPNYQPIDLRRYSDVHIWGVATYSIHTITRRTKQFRS